MPKRFNGLLSLYRILFHKLTHTDSELPKEVIAKAKNLCDDSILLRQEDQIDYLIEVPISCFDPYEASRITVFAVNQAGFISNASEPLIANTLQSTPKGLKDLVAKPIENIQPDGQPSSDKSIMVKFTDPDLPIGVLTSFSLYQIESNSELTLIYSGLSREFLLTGLRAFRNYSFYYELYDFVGCRRKTQLTTLLTPESASVGQITPVRGQVQLPLGQLRSA